MENGKIAEIMEQIHTESPGKGYRRIKDDLAHDHKLNINEKTGASATALWKVSRGFLSAKDITASVLQAVKSLYRFCIAYYNNRRVQRNLGVLTPMERHYSYPLAA